MNVRVGSFGYNQQSLGNDAVDLVGVDLARRRLPRAELQITVMTRKDARLLVRSRPAATATEFAAYYSRGVD